MQFSFLKPQARIILFTAALAVLFFAGLFAFREPLGLLAWEITHTPRLARSFSPESITLNSAIGSYFFGQGAHDLAQAKTAYSHVIALESENRDANYQLARIHFLEGNFPRAIEHIDKTLRSDPGFAKALYMKGLILGYQGNLIEATTYFEKFIARVPENWAGYNDLAWLHFQLGRYEETLSVAEAGLAVSPENAWLLNMQGLALLNLEKRREAREAFLRAKTQADSMEPEQWGRAYPGNDPKIYTEGLERMREAIDHNLALLKEQ